MYYHHKKKSKDWNLKTQIETVLHNYPSYSHKRLAIHLKINKKRVLAAAQESAKTMIALLIAVAAITLLVSGIGIINVMFVTVAERIKEIEIAKAIGEKRSNILSQFLLELVILSMVSGIIGMIIGQGVIPIISYFIIIIMASSLTGPIIGFSFSVLVGVFFGFYPAYQTSRLDPVDALRSE